MTDRPGGFPASGAIPRRLFFYNAGFLRQPRLRRILRAAGHELRLGLPGPDDGVVVWGRSPYAARGEAVAARRGVPLIRLEDAFLRSVAPGRARGDKGPLGLIIDPFGAHFDSASPSLIERTIVESPLDDAALLQRARDGIGRMKALDLSKYNNFDETRPAPAPGYVLVVDQTRDDASIRYGAGSARLFREMLGHAQIDHPGARIVIRAHPETRAGLRPGHYGPADLSERISIEDGAVSPWKLLDGAIAVYTVSSLLGYEAILAGHRPRVFGQPFYAGWGLTEDMNPVPRRTKRLTRAQIFAASHILAPTWFDACRDRICSFEDAVDQLEAETRAWRDDRAGHVAAGMRLWKRAPIRAFFGQHGKVTFPDPPERAARLAAQSGRDLLVWANRAPATAPCPVLRVEDGFLRSRGLGAELVPPLSLIADRTGVYYDPSAPSDLERLIGRAPPPGGRARAERLIAAIRRGGVTKYNLGGGAPDLPPGHRILVPGQVEDDASIRLGAGKICTNLMLLGLVRRENPDAIVIFKPHPDVEAGLRPGRIDAEAARAMADVVLTGGDPAALIEAVDEVWTMTSLMGFEALLRGKTVVTTGAPFYAGWGLTRDLGQPPERRRAARPDLIELAYAALIAYPRYRDPVSGLPCPPEVVVSRLADGVAPLRGPFNRVLAKAQGALASHAWLWR